MKIEKAKPKREKRPSPLSFRFSKETVRQLKELAKATNRNMTEIIEMAIESAHKDTVK